MKKKLNKIACIGLASILIIAATNLPTILANGNSNSVKVSSGIQNVNSNAKISSPSQIKDVNFRKNICLALGLGDRSESAWELTDADLPAIMTTTVLDLSFNKDVEFQAEKIKNVSGLELFTSLKELNLKNNDIATINLDANTMLARLDISKNLLSNIDVSKNVNLEYINVSENKLGNINFTNNLELRQIYINQNQISSADVSFLKYLTHIDVSKNQFTSIDVSKNLNLRNLNIGYNQIPDVDISLNTKLEVFNCSSNPISVLDMGNNTELVSIDMGILNLTEKEWDFTFWTKLKYLNCYSNGITSLNVSNNKSLVELNCSRNLLTEVDLISNNNLKVLDISKLNLTNKELDFSNYTELVRLSVTNNLLNSINIENNLKLEYINTYANNLTDLNLDNKPNLKYLQCDKNKLTQLDVTKNNLLETLNFGSNDISNIDLSNNILLKDLKLKFSKISQLKLDNNLELEILDCSNTNIEDLVIPSSQIKKVYFSNNKIPYVNLSGKFADVINGNNQIIDNILVKKNGSKWEIDMKGIVGDKNVSNVEFTNANGGTYDNASGILSFNSKPDFDKVVYKYNTQNNNPDIVNYMNNIVLNLVVEQDYKININYDNSKGSVSKNIDTAIAGEKVTITPVANAGYRVGTITVISGGFILTDNSFTMPAEDVTINVEFNPTNNTITFDANSGTGTMTPQEIKTGASANLTANGFSKAGYIFKGWNTEADGSGTAYANNASYTMGTSNVTLYAMWENVNYTVTANTDANGTVFVDKPIGTVGEIVTVIFNANQGYQLKAGSLKVTAVGGVDVPLTQVTRMVNGRYTFEMPAEDVVITAEFELIPMITPPVVIPPVEPPVVEPELPTPPTTEETKPDVNPETGKNPTTGTSGVAGLLGAMGLAGLATIITKKRKNK